MKVTIYDKDTGKYLHLGSDTDPKVQQFVADGHIQVNGRRKPTTMWDFVTLSVIDDTDKIDKIAAREAKKTELRQRWGQRRADLLAKRGTMTSLPDVIAAVEELIDMLEVPEDTV